jgi:hypothetical protein
LAFVDVAADGGADLGLGLRRACSGRLFDVAPVAVREGVGLIDVGLVLAS